MNISIQISLWIPAFSSFLFRSEAAESHVNSILIFWGTATVFSTMAAPFYILIKSVQEFHLLHILIITCYFLGVLRQWHPTPVLLPGKSHGRRSLVGCSPWGREESDTTERLHFSLSCIGEGNGNPLQCSCLENPRDGGAWWAAVYEITQSWTRLKRLSSSSSSSSSSPLTTLLITETLRVTYEQLN